MNYDVVLNPAEPDATYNKHRGVGSLVQVMETYSPEAETLANPDESAPPQAGPDHARRRRPDERPRRLGARAGIGRHGGAGHQAEGLAGRLSLRPPRRISKRRPSVGVEVIAPAMPPKGSKQDKLTLEDFDPRRSGPSDPLPGRPRPAVDERGEGSDPGLVRRGELRRMSAAWRLPGLGGWARTEPRFQYTRDRVRNRQRRWASGRRRSASIIAGVRGSRGRCRG